MSSEQNVEPPQREDEPEPARPHDPIEPDPMNPKSVPPPAGNEPQRGELKKELPKEEWDWAEHED